MLLGGAGVEKKKMSVLRILFFSLAKFNFSPSDIFVSFLSAWSVFALLLAAGMSHQKKKERKENSFRMDGHCI